MDFRAIEKRLQGMIESLGSILPERDASEQIARQLLDCIQANPRMTSAGTMIAPGHFEISFYSTKLFDQFCSKDRLPGIAHALEQVALENDFSFLHTPSFLLKVDPGISPARIKIDCLPDLTDLSETSAVKPIAGFLIQKDQKAQLMLDDGNVFYIKKNIINIGRRADNDLVIDRLEISRSHAQIRCSQGKFTLFDLNSSGGTYLNDQRISRGNLQPGDVITLANVKLIFISEIDSGEKTSPIKTSGLEKL